ncbi:MAG: translation elongation factor Ts [Phycisphaerae bacterium]
MAEITAAMVKALREETGQGMMDCKKALEETGGDVEAAKDMLRKKGGQKAAEKAGRATGEGLIAIADSDGAAAMVEVRCETDFCARNEVFSSMVQSLAETLLGGEAGPAAADDAKMTGPVQDAFNKIGENMSFARGVKISGPCVGHYLHFNGKVGVIVALDKAIDDELLKDLCMHIAFANPLGIVAEDIPAEMVEKERKFIKEEVLASGKPEEIAEKMTEGKMRKFFSGVALHEQAFVKDDKKTVKQVIGEANVTEFARFAVGEDS